MTVDERRAERPSLAGALAAEEEGLLTCVHCGFCLPACPTYVRLGDENDSPRGRLYLMRAVVEGRLEPDAEAFQLHIDRCLGCRACEPVCPSGVPYGSLLELARGEAARARRPALLARAFLRVFASARATRAFLAVARALRATRLPALAARGPVGGKGLPRLRLALGMLAATSGWDGLRRAESDGGPRGSRGAGARPAPVEGPDGLGGRRDGDGPDGASPAEETPDEEWPDEETPNGESPGEDASDEEELDEEAPDGATPGEDASDETGGGAKPAHGPTRVEVGMLEGCVQAGLFARVNRATVRVLEANGVRVRRSPGQGCCGALHAHGGDRDGARALARRNIRAFEGSGVERVVVNAAGCGAVMKEYGDLLAGDPAWAERAARFSAKVRDVSEVLAEHGPRPGASLRLRVAYDPPCHLLHAQGVADAPGRVLGAVPGLELVEVQGADACCGGAGIYGLLHPDLGGRIGSDKVDALVASGAEVVATGNPGCIMQIGAGLRMRDAGVAALHPVEVLDESYRRADMYRTGSDD